MNGEEFLRSLKRDEVLRSIPVVVVSTDGTGKRVHRMRRLGARAYVIKPFQPEVLSRELEHILEVPYA
jgi:two-component system chemotaxis response regulator CheY